MEGEYTYEAFISYRHLPLDRKVARITQWLLETYRPPKGLDAGRTLGHIFRDRTDLPTSGDLTDALQRALDSSRFLIVILSPQLKESKWCMEEIRRFKEAHGGRIDHILSVLVEGEPSESIPDILRHETREVILPDGTSQTVDAEVEPLCCDVRSRLIGGWFLKLINAEMLRLAAPMLGVSYDDLYQRDLRRRHRRLAAFTAAGAVILGVVLTVISGFAFQTYRAEQRVQRNLVDNYARQGASQIALGDNEKAMLYYASALSLDSGTQAAKTGALLLLQQHGWLNHVSAESGGVLGERVCKIDWPSYAMDASGERFLTYADEGFCVTDGDMEPLEDLSAYGDFVGSAPDGSCWTFATEDTVTFYFTADGSVSQVDRPTAINPLCDPEDAEWFGEYLNCAMAVDRENAAVCCGGYLYRYALDGAQSRGMPAETYDLALVFEEEASFGRLPVYYTMWADAGGHLCAVSDGSSVAVFSLKNSIAPCLCATHVQYGRSVQDVVFSRDGRNYAIVYGNDIGIFDPGGCLEVYNEYGEPMMATEFKDGAPLEGAVFEPNGTRIAAWGNGAVQVYDWQTGAQAAATLQASNIDALTWLEDGRLAAGNGNGVVDYYEIVHYEAAQDSPVTLEEYVEPDSRGCEEVVLSSGVHFLRSAMSVSVTDAQGNEIERCWLSSIDSQVRSINRLFLDEAHDTAYVWYKGNRQLLAIKADESGITSALMLNARGKNPLEVYSAYGGVLAEMGTGELFYYEDGQTEASVILTPNRRGPIQCIAADENGLVCFIVRTQEFTQGYSFEYLYSAELWDLNKKVMLAELARDSRKALSMLTFADDRLAFKQGDDTVTWLLNAPAPDGQAIAALGDICCYQLDEAQNALVAVSSFDPAALGNWNTLLREIEAAKPEEAENEEERFEQGMQRVLEEQGEEAWLAAYAGWWASPEPDQLPLEELVDRTWAYLRDARERGHEDALRPAVQRSFEIFSQNVDTMDELTQFRIEGLVSAALFYAPQDSQFVFDYLDALAASSEREMQENEGNNGLYEYYSKLNFLGDKRFMEGEIPVLIRSVLGEPDEGDVFQPVYLYMQEVNEAQALLLSGEPLRAAELWERAEQLVGDTYDDLGYDYQSMSFKMGSLVERGLLSEEDYSAFFGHLERKGGVRLKIVTNEELEAGLRLNDFVVAVNGVYICQGQYLKNMGAYDQPARLTVLRDGETLTIDVPANWHAAGNNDII